MNLNKLHDIILDNSKDLDVKKLTIELENELARNKPYNHSSSSTQDAFNVKITLDNIPKFNARTVSEFGEQLEQFYTKREITFMFATLFDSVINSGR